jgi:3'-phosphoadenosine 5'-phosphosulfate sulfotransferase (PAPS reductase)/FAD synthetase
MKEKIEQAKELINMIARSYRNPIIMSGFGKEGTCIVHLCHSMGYRWPVMFHKDAYFPKKYSYANQMIELWDLVCHDYPPYKCSVYYRNEVFDTPRHYQLGASDMVICTMLYEPEKFINGEYLCALKDIYLQPKGTMEYMWDVALQGFRYDERKPHKNMVPHRIRWHVKHNIDSVDIVQPIREWTSQDVYQYLVDNNIPINWRVYEEKDGELILKEDKTYDPDRKPACYRCMLPDVPLSIMCPKKKCLVNNVWDSLNKLVLPNDFPDENDGGV